jgi:hypothetical protein
MTTLGTGGLPNAFGCPGIQSEPPPITDSTFGISTDCECLPGDTYFVIERSARMGERWGDTTRFLFVKEALSAYAVTPGRGGLIFSGALDVTTGGNDDACDPQRYLHPALVYGGGAAGSPGLAEALAQGEPSGKNPLLLALQGLLAFAHQSPDRPTGVIKIVLVTATAPDSCPDDVTADDVVQALSAARASDPTLSIALIALDPDYDVDVLATAAGTLPFRVGPDEPPSRLLEALRRVTSCGGRPRATCENVDLPPPPSPPYACTNIESAWVSFDTPTGTEALPRLAGPDACASSPQGGFFFDPSQGPLSIGFCPCSSQRMDCSVVARYTCAD